MWIVTALLILVGWTGLGFVTALLFFRLGFGFAARRGTTEVATVGEDGHERSRRLRVAS